MRHLASLLALAALITSAFAGQVKMKISGNGVSGDAVVLIKVLDDGSLLNRVTMNLDAGGKVKIFQESTYDKTGRPIKKTQTIVKQNGTLRQTITATFGKTKVVVAANNAGKQMKADLAFPRGSSILAKSELWFSKIQPRSGDINEYSRFDPNTQAWVKTKVIYKGRKSIKVGGTTYTAHLIETDGVQSYMDDKGDPIKTVTPSFTMERIP